MLYEVLFCQTFFQPCSSKEPNHHRRLALSPALCPLSSAFCPLPSVSCLNKRGPAPIRPKPNRYGAKSGPGKGSIQLLMKTIRFTKDPGQPHNYSSGRFSSSFSIVVSNSPRIVLSLSIFSSVSSGKTSLASSITWGVIKTSISLLDSTV